MHADLLTTLLIAAVAAIAAPTGGLIGLWRQPSTVAMSIALGFASGVLLAAVAFEMVPKSLELGSLPITVVGFACGFAALWAFDLFIHRGKVAGDEADEGAEVDRHHRRNRPHGGDKAAVIGGGTIAEEAIEGLSIGVGAAIDPGIGMVVASAIVADNFAGALSLGEMTRDNPEFRGRAELLRVLGWTSLIGVSLFVATLAGWVLLSGVAKPVLGFSFAAGAGAMFYLTMTHLAPASEERHYQRSAGIATAAGFLSLLALGHFL